MYVRVGGSAVDDGFGSAEDEDTERLEAGAALPWRDSLGGGSRRRSVRERVRAARALLDRPLTSYYLILGITTLLLCLGLMMVLSTASVTDLTAGESPYHDFEWQVVGIVVGLPIMWLMARSSPRVFRAMAYPLLAVSVIGLGLTLIPGVAVKHNDVARWIAIGPITFQPSELAKLALAVWGADLLARKEKLGMLVDWRHLLVPLMPGAGVLAMLVMAGDDLGTTSILLIILLALLWIAGIPTRVFTALLILMGLVLVLLIVAKGYGAARITDFLNPQNNTNPVGTNQQPIQGKLRAGLRRSVRRWPRREQGAVGLAARVLQRLHLRDHRRGTWPCRHAVRDRAVRWACVGRPPGRPPCPRYIQPAGRRRDHGLDRDAGGGEHRRGDRGVPDHRGAAAAGLPGPVIGAGDDDRAGYAHVVCATGTRSEPGIGGTRPRRWVSRSKLAWPGDAART